MAGSRKIRPEQKALAELREQLISLREIMPTLSRPAATKAMIDLLAVAGEIEKACHGFDPIKEPGASFDPTNPDTVGHLVALALVAQNKVPLTRIARTYGSGIYAIYYHGNHPDYAVVSGTETPVYVGKADPTKADARTSREQGPQLYGRLADHRRMIKIVGEYAIAKRRNPLNVEDFSCRRLVCATNAQLAAERHLIGIFRPIWNNEIGICWGISKHGDSPNVRANKRSPWDVMHPGRLWALDKKLEDKMSPQLIRKLTADHFKTYPPYRSRARIVHGFLSAFIQNAAMTADEVAEDDDAAT